MTKDYGVQREQRRFLDVTAAIMVLGGCVGIVIQDGVQRHDEGIADARAWLAPGPRCPTPANGVFRLSGDLRLQVIAFAGMTLVAGLPTVMSTTSRLEG